MLAAIFMLASTTASHAIAFPAQFIGRWEKSASDCKKDVELRDTDGFVVVKRNKLEYYEAEAKLLSIKMLAPGTYQASIAIDENEQFFHERPRLKLIAANRLVFLSGALRGTYARCGKPK